LEERKIQFSTELSDPNILIGSWDH